ncbi:MAG: ubiquinol-cytochrome c reductase iron-sulfur subunit [Alphaproteobacteria bacterium]
MSATHDDDTKTRRDFLYIATGAFGATGAALTAWPFIDQMNPSAAVRALATIEIDLSTMSPGQQVKVLWQGKPIFVRYRTPEEIQAAEEVDVNTLPDPTADADRHPEGRPEWLVMIGICTHLGCVPLGEAGDFKGWFCPCHGSHYDTAGRIRKGPAPRNLDIPPYTFVNDTTIQIG